jgi:hypothetical protein
MFESRTSELNEEEFRKILNEKCKDFIKTPKLLQRSKTKSSPKFTYINPKEHLRSPLVSNDPWLAVGVASKHHILLMDNLPSWSKFPKRSQSLIGVTMEDPRSLFGKERYLVIPYDGAKFGVAPSSDLWSCNVTLKCERALSGSVDISFNDNFSNMMKNNAISDSSYTQMISDLQKRYDDIKKYISQEDYGPTSKMQTIFYEAYKQGFEKIEDALNVFLNPRNFKGSDIDDMQGFNRMVWKEEPFGGLATSLGEYDFYEFWTDSECLLYHIGSLTAGSEIEESYNKFCSDFLK